MQTTEDTNAPPTQKSVVRSLRFPQDAWARISKKAKEQGIPQSVFLRNAVLEAAGVPNEAAKLRELADQIDNMSGRGGKSAKAKPTKTVKKR